MKIVKFFLYSVDQLNKNLQKTGSNVLSVLDDQVATFAEDAPESRLKDESISHNFILKRYDCTGGPCSTGL